MSTESKTMIPQMYGSRSLHEALWQFQQTRQFTDLTLSCSDGTLPAHRAMLAGAFKMLGLPTGGQEEEVECLVIPDVVVSEMKQAMEELYLKSKSEKLFNLLSCKNLKSEMVDVLNIVEVKPEVVSDEEYEANDAMLDVYGIKQELKMQSFEIYKPLRKNMIEPLNPLNAKNPDRPKHIERLKSLTCDQCDHIAKNVDRLQKHKHFSHENKHDCHLCNFKTTLRQKLETHIRELHPYPERRLQKKLQNIMCDQCDFVAKRPERLAGHKKREHGKRLPCDECKNSYLDPERLEKHKRIAHDKTIRQCDQCPFQTNNKNNLVTHKRIKHSDQMFYCDQCDFSSKINSSLRSHIETQHEGRRFYCEQCDYSAPYTGGLIRHIKMVHEGVTYQCEFCEHTAKTNSNLKLHVDAKHLGIKYPCDQCSYQASQPGSLKIHKQTKHSVLPGQQGL